ncbi:MAG: LptF/LptG family permease [Spirochaetia bacterium]|nr:LptF/LptG family permease [Spirochaetota bacterium]MDW8112231.1 LptF/LptG family permease [Spirochaetia bacterium]
MKTLNVITSAVKNVLKRVISHINSSYIPLKRYDIMVYKDLAISYVVSFLIISLVVWLKEVYLIYVQYIQKGAQLTTTLSIFFYSLPFTMAITIPAGMIMATLLTFNKLSLNLEILVLRSSGIRKTRLFLPVLVFSLLIGSITYTFFDTVLIKGNEMYIRSMIKMRVEKPFIDINPGEFPKIGDFNIGFEELQGGEMKGVEIYQKTKNSEKIIKANTGRIISTGDVPYYSILLFNGTYIDKSSDGSIFSSQFKEAELRIDYEVSYIPTYNTELQPRLMSRYKTEKIIEKMKEQTNLKSTLKTLSSLNEKLIENYKKIITTLPEYIFSLLKDENARENAKKHFNSTLSNISELSIKIKSLNTSPEMVNYNIFIFEQHKKTSIPVSAIVYGLIGFVFGIMVKVRTGKGGSLIIGIIIILIQTYLTFISEIPIRNGDLDPVIGAWWSNIVLTIPALYLLLREKA